MIYVASYALTLPYAWLLFVAGPGVVMILPIVAALGMSGGVGLRDWAFPEPLCPHCGACTEYAPAVERMRRTELLGHGQLDVRAAGR